MPIDADFKARIYRGKNEKDYGGILSGGEVRLRLPFDRFYMNEEDASAAETAYRRHSNRKKRDAYVAVRVLNGFAILEDLLVGGVPINEFLTQEIPKD